MVVADSVNPLAITREAGARSRRAPARRASTSKSSAPTEGEHRRRITRQPDIDGHKLPTWNEVTNREYHAWDRNRLIIDSALETVDHAVQRVTAALA
jgi:hypothetical protein